MRTKIKNMFRDWFNNFGSVDAFADYYGISRYTALRVIEAGRKLHNQEVKRTLGKVGSI